MLYCSSWWRISAYHVVGSETQNTIWRTRKLTGNFALLYLYHSRFLNKYSFFSESRCFMTFSNLKDFFHLFMIIENTFPQVYHSVFIPNAILSLQRQQSHREHIFRSCPIPYLTFFTGTFHFDLMSEFLNIFTHHYFWSSFSILFEVIQNIPLFVVEFLFFLDRRDNMNESSWFFTVGAMGASFCITW